VVEHTRAGPRKTSADNGGILSTDGHLGDSDAGIWLQPNSRDGCLFHALIPPGWRRTLQRYLTLPAFLVNGRSGRTRMQGDKHPPQMRAPIPLDQTATAVVFPQSEFQLAAGGDHRRWDIVRNNGPA
jgi:hypothetical protein